ncbi:hypothetical protein C8J57DRAFT_1605357 [Mycena rebaudengoi]|nr:hypothetical protein C8J57DRAFT_1605357 [Mycena rebaudengoi]
MQPPPTNFLLFLSTSGCEITYLDITFFTDARVRALKICSAACPRVSTLKLDIYQSDEPLSCFDYHIFEQSDTFPALHRLHLSLPHTFALEPLIMVLSLRVGTPLSAVKLNFGLDCHDGYCSKIHRDPDAKTLARFGALAAQGIHVAFFKSFPPDPSFSLHKPPEELELCNIEILVQQQMEALEAAGQDDDALREIQKTLYSTEEGFEVFDDGAVLDEEETF